MTVKRFRVRFALLSLLVVITMGPAQARTFYHEKPNTIAFEAHEAAFVRVLIHATQDNAQPCVDEFEVYGPEGKNLADAATGAVASASASLEGYAIHKVEHLNDGAYGNSQSWIGGAAGGVWLQIALPQPTQVASVVFSRDRAGRYKDRMPIDVEVLTSLDGAQFTSVAREQGRLPGSSGQRNLPDPPGPPRFVQLAEATMADEAAGYADQVPFAFLAEEHAWLKTAGYADLSSRLVPYNGRVKEYPRHVPDDRLPLPELTQAPEIDGVRSEAAWGAASQGTAWAAYPYDRARSPLMDHQVEAGIHEGSLYLALTLTPIASGHLAVVSSGDWESCLLVKSSSLGKIRFANYGTADWENEEGLEGALNTESGVAELCIPLRFLSGYAKSGVRIGLALGGKHTPKTGRGVTFVPASFSLREAPAPGDRFTIRLANTAAESSTITLPEGTFTLAAGETRLVEAAAEKKAFGPEYAFHCKDARGEEYTLQAFRYDPARVVLNQAADLITRLGAKGAPVAEAATQLAAFTKEHQRLMQEAAWDATALRRLYAEARAFKRDLFMKDPELAPLSRLLFVKRQAFRPSHNYSVILDAPWRPGGGIYTLEIPIAHAALNPAAARLTELFNSKEGIARNPMASFDAQTLYFGYSPAQEGYYHLMAMDADGGNLRQLTEGPFHDYWPCPLPDGGLAFITTRCKARFLCWRPQAAVMFRMDADGSNPRPLSFANLSEWAPSVMNDGRIIWTRSEYVDKGADFGHTLWAIRPDGSKPELVFGNTIIQPNGYANGREVPGTNEICCTLISHFGDLNGPIALVDIDQGRFNPEAIKSITPEVPWPGMWPVEEAFRDPVPIAKDLILCAHAPRQRFGLYVIDRYGNRELLHIDPAIGSMCPTPLHARPAPPVIAQSNEAEEEYGEFVLADVYQGIDQVVEHGRIKYLRIVEEVRADLSQLENGEYRADHEPFMHFYASPVDLVNGPYGWPTYVAKTSHGIVPVEEDGSARFYAPAGKVLFFEALDENYTEIQRMRSVVQLQPGEKRSCIGCHEHRQMAPPNTHRLLARTSQHPDTPAWAGRPFSYEETVQPVLDAHCIRCHNADHPKGLDFRGVLDENRIPASYRNLISQGLVHYCDYGWNSGGCEKRDPLSFGTVKSRLWEVLDAGHNQVLLNREEVRRIKTWIDLNCPLWPDYIERTKRPGPPLKTAQAQ